MADVVDSVLRAAAEKENKLKTTEVHKDIDLLVDAGNLLAVDQNPLDLRKFKLKKEEFLRNLARDNAQVLINKIWELPIERVEDAIVCKLPPPKTILPREKPLPKVKAATRWDQYSQLKSVQNRKKGRMVWDEKTKDWKPRWGYKRANDETKEWVIEVPQSADPYEDQFEKRMNAKKERVAKNELQRLRNIARSHKGKVPGVGLTPVENPSKDYIGKALTVAKKSTASIGKFTDNLPKEKPSRNTGKKRKFQPNFSSADNEKKKQLDIFKSINSKKSKLDVNVAANKHMRDEDEQRRGQKGRKATANISKKKVGGKTGKRKTGKKMRTK